MQQAITDYSSDEQGERVTEMGRVHNQKVVVTLQPVQDCAAAIPQLGRLFRETWPDWYSNGEPGSATKDLADYSNDEALPFGLVAWMHDEVCGFAGLKTDGLSDYAHLGPWLGSACVRPALRNRGIGGQLVSALEDHARELGHAHLFAGTRAAAGLLERRGWRKLGHAVQHGEALLVFEKTL